MNSPSRLLDELKSSEFFAPDFPKRPQRTRAEAARAGKIRLGPDIEGMIKYEKRFDRPVDIIRQLGQAKHEAAVPTLAHIWRFCPVLPARVAAGHALKHIGTTDALQALIAYIDDADPFSTHMAVRAIFDRDPAKAYDALSPYFNETRLNQPGGHVVAWTVFEIFGPSSYSRPGGHQWTEPRAPQWFLQDPRWIEVCTRLRHNNLVGEVARRALRHAGQDQVRNALANHPETKSAPNVQAHGDLLSRYRSGQLNEVWRELRSFQSIAGDLRLEALAVARETLKRVAHNLDLLASRFSAKGWRSLTTLRTQPNRSAQPLIDRIEKMSKGPLPPTILAFWEIVGGVDLAWDYRQNHAPPKLHPTVTLNLDELDPLWVDPPESAEYLLEEWQAAASGVDPEILDPFSLDLAPDYLHKANISGGPPYAIELPFLGADPIFANESHELHFVDYLRHCLKWGGFGMLDDHADAPGVHAMVTALTAGFEPF